jgi:hypothetical protein
MTRQFEQISIIFHELKIYKKYGAALKTGRAVMASYYQTRDRDDHLYHKYEEGSTLSSACHREKWCVYFDEFDENSTA